jgi:hypothetical protein
VIFLGTIRSEFSIEQFEEAFQRFAHKVPKLIPKFEEFIANDAYTTLNLRFLYDRQGIQKIEVYYLRRKSLEEWGESYAFTVEPKDYLDSPHITKIHYEGGNDKSYNEKILAWLKELMAGMKPQLRFKLENMGSFPRKLDVYLGTQNAKTRKGNVT